MRVGIKIPTDSEHRYNAKNIVRSTPKVMEICTFLIGKKPWD